MLKIHSLTPSRVLPHAASCRTEFWVAALVAVSTVRSGRVSAMGRAAGVGGGARKAGGGCPLRSIVRQARRLAASSGHLVWSRPKVSRALPTQGPASPAREYLGHRSLHRLRGRWTLACLPSRSGWRGLGLLVECDDLHGRGKRSPAASQSRRAAAAIRWPCSSVACSAPACTCVSV